MLKFAQTYKLIDRKALFSIILPKRSMKRKAKEKRRSIIGATPHLLFR